MGERHQHGRVTQLGAGHREGGWSRTERRGRGGQIPGIQAESAKHLRVCFRCPLTQCCVTEERAAHVGVSPRVRRRLDRHPGGGPVAVWLIGKLLLTGLRTVQTGLEQANQYGLRDKRREGVVFPWGIHPSLREGRERGEVWRPGSG